MISSKSNNGDIAWNSRQNIYSNDIRAPKSAFKFIATVMPTHSICGSIGIGKEEEDISEVGLCSTVNSHSSVVRGKFINKYVSLLHEGENIF
ncbi:hypothetical protein CEXT_15221 [Caerostris extrusa]|uniref:Uncharacterized protein n=1 Tax=Caerostris extrusa TaxID=172846 RepID=A0AAV4WVC3_CAEEX|nr:hypothetical protein CEXT_15221 [Caerostris extrusa]